MITVHGMSASGNCYKVQLLLTQLGRPFRWIEVDTVGGATRTPEFLAKNPNRKVPLLELEDGRTLAESNSGAHVVRPFASRVEHHARSDRWDALESEWIPQIPPHQFPGQALAIELYRHAGIRSVEIGSVMFGDAAKHELLRLAIPRRVYTQSHIDYVIEAILEVNERKSEIRGVEIVEQPPFLRHFSARFRPL